MDVVVPQTGSRPSVYTTQRKIFATCVALIYPEHKTLEILKTKHE